jgi:hypothetical protein
MPNDEMPKPHIAFGVLMIALPIGRHVIENITVTSADGRPIHDFDVDGIPVMPPVTSDETKL